jgi:hypothetical protein
MGTSSGKAREDFERLQREMLASTGIPYDPWRDSELATRQCCKHGESVILNCHWCNVEAEGDSDEND